MSGWVDTTFMWSGVPKVGSSTTYNTLTLTKQWILSASYSWGQTNFTDTPGPGQMSIVINNDDNRAKMFDIGVGISMNSMGVDFQGIVESIDLNDAQGSLKGATATLNLIGTIGRLGKIKVTNKAITSTSTYQQLNQFNGAPLGGNIFFYRPVSASFYGVTQGAQTYTGTILQYLQTTQQTEGNLVRSSNEFIWFVSHIDHALYFSSTVTSLSPNSSDTEIAYESIERNYLDSELANYVTVTPAGLSGQVGTNSTSVTSYDQREYSRGTYDWATATALSHATWIANILSDRAVQIFTVTFTLEAQNQTAWYDWYGTITAGSAATKLYYKSAGSSDLKYEWVFVTHVQCNATPEKTVFTLTCMPANMFMPAANGYSGSDSYALLGKTRYNLVFDPTLRDSISNIGTKFTLTTNYADSYGNYLYVLFGYTSLKGTISTGTAGQSITLFGDDPVTRYFKVKPNTTYTFSIYVITPATNTANTQWRVRVQGQSIAGVNTTSTNGTTTTLVRDKWTRLSVTHTTAATTNRLGLIVESVSTLAVGQVVYVANALFEESSTVNEYFDGSQRPATWISTAYVSPSVLEYNYFRYGRTV